MNSIRMFGNRQAVAGDFGGSASIPLMLQLSDGRRCLELPSRSNGGAINDHPRRSA